ncbi:MAG: hypothetical protein M9927_24585 [Anaerolineae bacterium]|nr:hypothetical protein [Anaerolineae bacterium]
MTGDRGTVASQMPSYGVAVTGTDPTVVSKNNIFTPRKRPAVGRERQELRRSAWYRLPISTLTNDFLPAERTLLVIAPDR